MRRRWFLLFWCLMALWGANVALAQTEVVPPPVAAALNAFNLNLTQPITADRLDSYQFTQGTYSDTALGCTLVAGAPLAAPTTAYRVQLVFQGVLYEFEVSTDTTLIVPCSPPLITPSGPIAVATVVGPMLGVTGCPVDFAGLLPPQLVVGRFARIGTDGQPNRLRAAPSLDAEQIGLIAPGTTVEVLDGPYCEPASQIVWWQVRDGDQVGFTAESQGADYFLEPVEVGSIPLLPAAREPITALSAPGLVTLAAIPCEGGAFVDFGDESRLLVGGVSGLSLYDLAAQTVQTLSLPADTIVQANYSPDGQRVAYVTGRQQLFTYEVAIGQTAPLALDDGAMVNDLAFSRDGAYLAVALGNPLGGDDSAVNGWIVFDLRDGSRAQEYTSNSWVGDVAFDPASDRLAWLSDAVNVATLFSAEPAATWSLDEPTRTGLDWLPTDLLTDSEAMSWLAHADGSDVVLVDVTSGQPLLTLASAEDYLVGTIAFSAEGSAIAVMNRAVDDMPAPRTLQIFDVTTGDLLFSQTLETGRAMAVSPDGTLIAVVTDDTLRLYGVAAMGEAVG